MPLSPRTPVRLAGRDVEDAAVHVRARQQDAHHKNFARDVSARLRSRLLLDEDVYSWVRFVMGDNCDYTTRNVHEHTDRSGEYMHTINWLWVPLRHSVLVTASQRAILFE